MYIDERPCFSCAETTTHHDGKCTACEARERTARDSAWKQIPIEDRLRELRDRIEALEQGRF